MATPAQHDQTDRRTMLAALGAALGALAVGGCDDAHGTLTSERTTEKALGALLAAGAAVVWVDSIVGTGTNLQGSTGSSLGSVVVVGGYSNPGDGGGGVFYWDAASTAAADGGTVIGAGTGRWKRIFSGNVDVRWFGARGDNQQALVADTYLSDSNQTQQTADGAAINRAIRYLRSVGGGQLYIPRGIYRYYGYLECLNFSIQVTGDGPGVTVLQACDNSPAANGYGCLMTGPLNGNNGVSAALTSVVIENLSVDGNADFRAAPSGEVRAYNIALYGSGVRRINNVESINSVIDCLLVYMEQPDTAGVGSHVTPTSGGIDVINSRFANSFRNTVSCISGYRQRFTNCAFDKGGLVHGGTAPRACLDIEPDQPSRTVADIRFTSCSFADSNYTVIATTCCENVKFIGCTFKVIAAAGHGGGVGTDFPRQLVRNQDGQVEFTDCQFYGDPSYRDAYICAAAPYNPASKHYSDAYVKLTGCTIDGGGILNDGRSLYLDSTTFRNSRFPVGLSAGFGTCVYLSVKNVKVINVVDDNNYGGGSRAAVTIPNSGGGMTTIDIDGLDVQFVPELLNGVNLNTGGTSVFYGLYLARTSRLKMSNVHVGGYYRKCPTAFGITPSSGIHRDWAPPISNAPANTAGQTVTPGAPYYFNCTEYGNNA